MIAHVLIFGFVQGVGFRQAVKRKARFLGLTGWVKNLPDGSVEAMFSGPKKNIEEAIRFCKAGPFLSEVKDIDIKWIDKKTDFNAFEIVR